MILNPRGSWAGQRLPTDLVPAGPNVRLTGGLQRAHAVTGRSPADALSSRYRQLTGSHDAVGRLPPGAASIRSPIDGRVGPGPAVCGDRSSSDGLVADPVHLPPVARLPGPARWSGRRGALGREMTINRLLRPVSGGNVCRFVRTVNPEGSIRRMITVSTSSGRGHGPSAMA